MEILSGVKCTNNKKRILSLILAVILAVSSSGCQKKQTDPLAYRVYESSREYGLIKGSSVDMTELFAEKLCIAEDKDIALDKVDSGLSEAGAVFNLHDRRVIYSKGMYERMFPASTTKILTAYTALKHGNLNEVFTVSEKACEQSYDSTTAGLAPGDKITLKDLLYGLMLVSGNDAAVAIAEGISGDTDSFVKLMNKEAKHLGAVHSHFVTVNGLHDEEHYTCVYDMYLIFQAAVENKDFLSIISEPSYSAAFKSADGSEKKMLWETTNGYMTGEYEIPEGIDIIGGKTGTTGPAGSCLVLLALNQKKEKIISIVFHADYRYSLFELMSEMLELAK